MTISPEYAEELGRQIDELEAENERLREFSTWVVGIRRSTFAECAKLVNEFDCHLAGYPNDEAEDYYESGVADACNMLEERINALAAQPPAVPVAPVAWRWRSIFDETSWSHSSVELAPSKLLELADRIDTNKRSWLPISGHVVNVTFDLNEADAISAALRAFTAQPPSDPVETEASIIAERLRTLAACEDELSHNCAGSVDMAEFRKLQDIIDNQADQMLDLHEVLKSAYALHEFIAGAYVLSLADFRYLNLVSTKIKAALPAAPVETAKHSPNKCGRDCQYYDYFEMLRNWFADEIRRAPRVMITEDTDWCGSFEVTDEQVETACEAYADATNYYVKFHRGLSSPSADHMRKGMRAALSALSRPKEK